MTFTSFQSISPHSAYFHQEYKKPSLLVAGSSAFRQHSSITSSTLYQRLCQLDDDWIQRLDRTEILGGYNDEHDHIGHTGCVNALSWSPSGQLLASASDDRNVILWKLGSAGHHPVATQSSTRSSNAGFHHPLGSPPNQRSRHESAQSDPTNTDRMQSNNLNMGVDHNDDQPIVVQPWNERSFSNFSMGMLGKIQTGHRANIFSVKWAPNMSDRRLFTCAGDRQVRVFDINYLPTGGAGDGTLETMANGSEYTNWNQSSSGACIRVFRCHSNRAKRISTENSPDVFLTCGEDGEVRQMDLRTHHQCSSNRRYGQGCPAPLAHFPMGLYSLSISKTEPWLFAVAGRSPHVYLQDRRMIPRLILRDWGMVIGSHNVQAAEQQALTMCVRRFGLPLGGYQATWLDEDEKLVRLPFRKPYNCHRASVAQLERTPKELLEGLSYKYDQGLHVTACKINESTGSDIIVSYSGGAIYRFGLYDEAEVLHHEPILPIYPQLFKGEQYRPKAERQKKKQEWQNQFQPYIDSMKRRVLQFLFPLPAHHSHARCNAFWDDIRDLRDLLGDPNPTKLFTKDYCAVELCSILGHLMYMELGCKANSPESEKSRQTGSSSLHSQLAHNKQVLVTDAFQKEDDLNVYTWLSDMMTSIERNHQDQKTLRIASTLGRLQIQASSSLHFNTCGFEIVKLDLWDEARDLLEEMWNEVSDALPSRPIYSDEEWIRKRTRLVETIKSKYLSDPPLETGLTQHSEPEPVRLDDGDDEDADHHHQGQGQRYQEVLYGGPYWESDEDGYDDDDVSFEDDDDDLIYFDDDADGCDDDVLDYLEDDAMWYDRFAEISDDEMALGHDAYSYLYDGYEDEEEDDDDDDDNMESATDDDGSQEDDAVASDSQRKGSRKPCYTPHSNAPTVYPRNMYTGHVNYETIKDVNFFGRDDRYVVSGSDEKHWFLWDTETEKLKGVWQGDGSFVNVLEPHPSLPVVAVSGIDDTIKLFAPVTLKPSEKVASDRSGSPTDDEDEVEGFDSTKIADRSYEKHNIAYRNMILNSYNREAAEASWSKEMLNVLFGNSTQHTH